ncbi:PTB domain-containing engulfment adapter protein 1 isoform X2 [Alosa pseudoharengus]|uniref:PTB domain-containing engulfment adapter protein 1 isoform X2 n=1 Tax=Alosa pseudoharengus TaxID=34774 RepID=UPI003F89DB73
MNRAFNRKRDKSWMHTPEALAKHFIAYNAKFLGNTEVDQPKGTEIVRDAVRKLKFQRHIKKSEGQKVPKVELQISIYGVKILDPKTKDVLHNCQLHRISFCADDKTDKRIFTFICKDSESNKHLCYVFDSEKCAEEITLTIGQAFDLAYKKFLESGGKDVETRKQIGTLQKRIQELESENSELKKQLQNLEEQLTSSKVSPLLHLNSANEAYMLQRPSSLFWCHNLTSFSCLEISSVTLTPMSSPESNFSAGLLTPPPAKPALPKPPNGNSIPRPRAGSISTKPPSTDIFDMIPFSPVEPLVPLPASNGAPPPPPARPADLRKDLFGAEPFDPFICGAADFPPDIQSKLDEMQEGFKMGLTLEGTVFSPDPLDGRC